MVIDAVAILPSIFPIFGLDLRFFRVFRLLRVFRLVKLARYSKALETFGRVLKAKGVELVMIFVFLAIYLVLASSLIYYAEHDAQPEVFSSIPMALWWGVATLGKVGLGQTYPITIWGKLIAGSVAIVGIGLFALPAGILGSAFVDELRSKG